MAEKPPATSEAAAAKKAVSDMEQEHLKMLAAAKQPGTDGAKTGGAKPGGSTNSMFKRPAGPQETLAATGIA